MLPGLGDGTLKGLTKSRKTLGKTWGKVKRATGIKRTSSGGGDHVGGWERGGMEGRVTLKVGESYEDNYRTLVAFYQIYNPEKVGEVGAILNAYKGMEGRLFEKLMEMQEGSEDAEATNLDERTTEEGCAEGNSDGDVGGGAELGVEECVEGGTDWGTEAFASFGYNEDDEVGEEQGEETEETMSAIAPVPVVDFSSSNNVLGEATSFFNSPIPSQPADNAAPHPSETHQKGAFNQDDAWDTQDDPFSSNTVVVSHLEDIFTSGGNSSLTPNAEHQGKGTIADQMRQLSTMPPTSPGRESWSSSNDTNDRNDFSDSESSSSEEEYVEEREEQVQQKKKSSKKKVLSSIASKALSKSKNMAVRAAKSTGVVSSSSKSASQEEIPSGPALTGLLNSLHFSHAGPHLSPYMVLASSKIPPPSLLCYTWYSGSVVLPGVRGPLYNPNLNDVGKVIRCRVDISPSVRSRLSARCKTSSSNSPRSGGKVDEGLMPEMTHVMIEGQALRNISKSVLAGLSAGLAAGFATFSDVSVVGYQNSTSLSLLPVPSGCMEVKQVKARVQVEAGGDSSIELMEEGCDTPRGVLLGLSMEISLNLDPEDAMRMDIEVVGDRVEWRGDKGGGLWGYYEEWREKCRGTAGRYVWTLRFRGGDGGVDKIARDVVWGMGMEGKGEAGVRDILDLGNGEGAGGGGEERVGGEGGGGRSSVDECQLGEMKREIERVKEEDSKKGRRLEALKRQLEVTEEQLEQVSEAFEELVGDREKRDGEMERRLSELEEEREGWEGKMQGWEKEREKLEGEKTELTETVRNLERDLERKPSSLYKGKDGLGGGGGGSSAEGAAKWKSEAEALRRKCEGMSRDMKRLIKQGGSAKSQEAAKKEKREMKEDLLAYKKALEHALMQLDEMRMREIALLGNSFEYAPRPKKKSYVKVARNIVKMRKEARKAAKKAGKGIEKVVGKAEKVVGKASRAAVKGVKKIRKGVRRKSQRGSMADLARRGGFSDDDDDGSSDDEEVIDYGDSDCDDNDHRESINIDVEGS